MAVYECAEDAGGCGVVWTPQVGNRRPIRYDPPWAWCPDCLRLQEHEASEAQEKASAA